MSIRKWQLKYIFGGLAVTPFLPILYAQGKYVRYRVGRLPDAAGETSGRIGRGGQPIRLLAIGESTVAGVGAVDHSKALTGQFARHLSNKTGKSVEWRAVGESGITVRRTLNELIPQIAGYQFDLVLVSIGANDVFTLSSPQRWRRGLGELLTILRSNNPAAAIFVANVPMVRDFIALPNPLRYVLSRLAKLHHFNARDLISPLENIAYFDDVRRVSDDFFSDGIHPSALGYDLWSAEMVDFMLKSDKINRSGAEEVLSTLPQKHGAFRRS